MVTVAMPFINNDSSSNAAYYAARDWSMCILGFSNLLSNAMKYVVKPASTNGS